MIDEPTSRTVRSRIDARLVRYVAVGIVSFAIDFGILSFSYSVLHVPLWVATTLGFWLSFIVNFLLSKYFTFQLVKGTTSQLRRYSILVAINYLITLGIVSGAEAIGIGYLVGKVAALTLLTATTFIVYRKWVFVG